MTFTPAKKQGKPVTYCGMEQPFEVKSGLDDAIQSENNGFTAYRCTLCCAIGDDLLVRATDLYKQGRYGQAILRTAKRNSVAPTLCHEFQYRQLSFPEENFLNLPQLIAKPLITAMRYAPALFNLASVLFRLGEYPESVAAYRRALAINPENISAWLFLGEAYARTGDKVGTLRALEKAYESAPEDISIVYQLSEAYIALGDFANAVALVRKAYIQNPRETDFLIYVGDIYRLQKNYDECIGAYREALSISPDNTALLYKLADVLSESGNNYVAMDVLSQILQMIPVF
jgi:tetratricopeptide (TPR) repeat protein